MSATLGLADLRRIADEYDAAWRARDVEAIVAKHAPSGSYRLHVAGVPRLEGRDALRAAFTASLENWSEISFQLDRALFGDSHYVWQSTMRGVLARPLALGALTIEANGRELSLTGVDVITLDAEGLVESKETYFDLVGAANQAA